MLQFHYQQGASSKLSLFPHIMELSAKKNSSIQLHSFPEQVTEGLSIYYISEGRFEWKLNGQLHILFPGDVVVIQPGQKYGKH